MKIPTGEGDAPSIWDVPEATGPDAVQLRRLARRVIGDLGLRSAFAGPDAESAGADAPAKIGGHPESDVALRLTLIGSRYNGERVTPDVLARLDADPDRTTEPWEALFVAWVTMGFFGSGARRRVLAILEEIPVSPSPTQPSGASPSAEPTTAS